MKNERSELTSPNNYFEDFEVGQVIHDKEMRPPLNAGDDHIRFAKISLGMARGM